MLHERFQRRTNDNDIGAAEGCARGGAARDLQELHFAGDQSVHAFNAGGRGNHFHVQAMFVEDASFRAIQGGHIDEESEVKAMRTLRNGGDSAA